MDHYKTSPCRLWQAGLRETGILLREFRQPVLIFLIAIIGFGALYNFPCYPTG